MARTGAQGLTPVLRQLRERIVLDIDDNAVHGGQQLVQRPLRRVLLSAHPHLRRGDRQAGASLLRRASVDEALAPLRPHPAPLAPGRDRGAWRRPLRRPRSWTLEDQGHGYILGLPGNARLSEIGQGRGAAPGAISRPARQKLIVARVEAGGTDVSSSPTCRAAPNCSTRARGRRKHDQGAQALHQIRPAPRVDGKPTSSGCSCTPPPIGCCISCAGPRPAARRGAPQRSRRYDGHSSRSPCASRSSTPASRSPCPRPTHIATP